jgi:hypothetical protein
MLSGLAGPAIAAGKGREAGMEDSAREEKDRRPKAPDLLSPGRALDESLGASESQRIGNNEPVANPLVSFPGDVEEDEAA